MQFGGVNGLAVIVAGVAGFLFGAVWYGLLGSRWLAAQGKTKVDLARPDGGAGAMTPFVIAGISNLVMAWVLAGLLGHLGPGQVTVRNGLVSALFVFAGFVGTTIATNYAFQQARPSLTVIDAGHWLGVLLIQGLVLGLFGL